MPSEDATLDRLLVLDGDVIEVGGGFWVTIKARRVETSAQRPHGIDYSLSLIDRDGERVLGFDNAHSIEVGTGPGAKRTDVSDHLHKGERIRPYEYENAEKLLSDFWDAVEKVLKQEGVS